MFLLTRIARSLQNAIRPHVAPGPDANTGPAMGVARVASPRIVDGPTVPLPPLNSRYQPRRANVKALNRNSTTCTRHGSARTAVGL